MKAADRIHKAGEERALCQSPNKQLQRTVIRHHGRAASAPFHYALTARGKPQRAPLNCGVSRQPERIVVCVRLGYFEGFKGSNTLVLDGDLEGLGELARALGILAAGEQDVVSVHSLPFVSAEHQVELLAHRSQRDLGMSKTAGGFQWRRSAEGWAAVVEQILAVKQQGRCHQYLDAPADDVVVMVSSGEYGEPWPKLGTPPWAK